MAERYLIVGGTGTLGQETIKQLLKRDPASHIKVLSRSEHKQQELKKKFPTVRFVLGDIRDLSNTKREFQSMDTVFHFAALKHVDHVEENAIESVKTNVLGTINVAEACLDAGVQYCVFSSTDKAVDPINAYGFSKAISEKIIDNYNFKLGTRFSIFRWGNVAASQGSAIPYFIKCIQQGLPIPLTDEKMTRFWIPIDVAVDYLLTTYKFPSQKTRVPTMMKAAPVAHVIKALYRAMGLPDQKPHIVGMRPGEKLHEVLYSQHTKDFISSETAPQYTEPELLTLLAPLIPRKYEGAA